MLRHSAEALIDAERIVVAIPEGADEIAAEALSDLQRIEFITGGATRQESVRLALEALEGAAPELVLIHDAARPDLPLPVIERLLGVLGEHSGAIPVLPVVDSVVVAENDLMADDAKRETLRRVQTPQAFHYVDILDAHRKWQGEKNAGDDAQVLRAAGHDVALVEGDERLKKLTFAEDFVDETQQPPKASAPAMRVGMGYDVHRLSKDEELWLCGVKVEHHKGLAGHSDADVGLHAVVDAILGACAQGDIGQHFPPSDPQWRGAASSAFVEHAAKLAGDARWQVGNVDLTLICEAPKIGPHREAMRARLSELLGVAVDCVSVKATTTERLGPMGRGEGIAAQAIATLVSK